MPLHPPTLTLSPIGVVHSPWRDKRSAPRQPAEARDVRGQIALHARAELQDALSDLDAWTHIWVLFWFHLNSSWSAKVQPPRSAEKRGVFATRSPYRPNPLGLSVLRLERVEGCVLHVLDIDILDQTPVLDIKPYVAYTDSVAAAGSGWLETPGAAHGQGQGQGQAPAQRDAGPRFEVEFVERAAKQLAWLQPRAAVDLEALATNVLRAGPAPHAYRRIRVRDGYSELAVKDFRLRFRVVERCIQVFEITSGYRARVLADPSAQPSEQTPLSVHRELIERFDKS